MGKQRQGQRIDRRRDDLGRRAFTLIELLIVIAIVLAMGGLVVINLMPKKDQADIDLTRVQIDTLVTAMKLFRLDMKRWPTEDEGLAALWSEDAVEDEDDLESWRGPYTEIPIPEDYWKTEWIYRAPSEIEGFDYDIVSWGPDKEEGGDDDITNLDRMLDSEGELREGFEDFTPAGGDGP